jgi:hypothetical protein
LASQFQGSETRARLLAARKEHGILLDNNSGTSIGVEGYAGNSVLTMSERRRGHFLTGGLLRTRVGHFEFGGAVDQSDYADGKWRSVGGFIGLYFPYVNWVDIDATVGLAERRYVNHETRYGKNGAKVSVPSLSLQLGFSERSSDVALFGVRLGAAVFAQIDVARKGVAWDYQIQGKTYAAGTTYFGGTTVGLVMNLGFDLAFRPH